MSEQPDKPKSWWEPLVTWAMMAVIVGYIVALNVLAFTTVFASPQ